MADPSHEDAEFQDTEAALPLLLSQKASRTGRSWWRSASALSAAGALAMLLSGSWTLGGRPTTSASSLADLTSLAQEGDDGKLGFLMSKESGLCLNFWQLGPGSTLEEAAAVLTKCELGQFRNRQLWHLNAKQGSVRSLFTYSRCLQSSAFVNFAPVTSAPCKEDVVGQFFDLAPDGRLISLERQLDGTTATWCAVPSPQQLAKDGQDLILNDCNSPETKSWRWIFVGLDIASTAGGSQAGRPAKALEAETSRRDAAQATNGSRGLLTLRDTVTAFDLSFLLNGTFWWETQSLFGALSPSWDKWQDVFSLWRRLEQESSAQAALGTALLANLLSNIAFAGMNFVHGSNGENLNIWGIYQLFLSRFTGLDDITCDEEGRPKRSSCTWQRPKSSETTGILTVSDFAAQLLEGNRSLLSDEAFSDLYTGEKVPSWEDGDSQRAAFAWLASGLAAARKAGLEPANLTAAAALPHSARFAFDFEGLLPLLEEGFGWFGLREERFASDGAFGVSLVERMVERLNGSEDVLGLLMTESALSMHLELLQGTGLDAELVADLTFFEKYEPIEGFARLGGKAVLKQSGGRLRTVRLEYDGKNYTNFTDIESDADLALNKLSGWRFAEKAIIATLLAKTQLLTHVKTIHMELAPILQAVTVDTLQDDSSHPIRMLLEPFVHRSVQASHNNLKLWFEFRAAEFGLAPLPVEEQLRLLRDVRLKEPLNLADLDMELFAKARGLQQFAPPPDPTAEVAGEGEVAGGANITQTAAALDALGWNMFGEPSATSRRLSGDEVWHWKWLQRTVKVQRVFEKMIRGWLKLMYDSDDFLLQADEGLVAWWIALYEHLPAMRVAAKKSSDWLVGAKSFRNASAMLSGAKASASLLADFRRGPEVRAAQGPLGPPAMVMPEPLDPWAWQLNQSRESRRRTTTVTTTSPPPLQETGYYIPLMKMGTPDWLTTLPPSHMENLKQWARDHIQRMPKGAALQERRLSSSNSSDSAAAPLDPQIPNLDVESLVRVLRTLLVWMSWVHEDVGHSTADFLYNPAHTPGFVPADGVGIPLVPLVWRVAAFRNFVFLERPKLVDGAAHFMFASRVCNERSQLTNWWQNCQDEVHMRVMDNFEAFQSELRDLHEDPLFSQCGAVGFVSCLTHVESSASS
ncbi:unnamed protein product [Polarella glacialis]|uniref:Uncharacterized protein n=1 Tax=Polarella glacialis TaxID=89957 RepID=A0A813HUE9_POLGL|nr:unnamed protein product [Polarella glacialis]